MSKYFNKHILDELEERFDRWSQNPPRHYDTAPDGGIHYIFVSNKPDDELNDTVFRNTVSELLFKPKHLKKCSVDRHQEKREKKKQEKENYTIRLTGGEEIGGLASMTTNAGSGDWANDKGLPSGKSENSVELKKSGNCERSAHSERSETLDRSEQTARGAVTERSLTSDKSRKWERSSKSERLGKSEKTEMPEISGILEESKISEIFENLGASGKSEVILEPGISAISEMSVISEISEKSIEAGKCGIPGKWEFIKQSRIPAILNTLTYSSTSNDFSLCSIPNRNEINTPLGQPRAPATNMEKCRDALHDCVKNMFGRISPLVCTDNSNLSPTLFGPNIDEPLSALADYSYRATCWLFKFDTQREDDPNEVTAREPMRTNSLTY